MKKKIPRWMWVTFSVIVSIFLGLIDWITGYELNFFVFYFFPISLAAWYAGRRVAVVLSLLSAFVWAIADTHSGNIHSSQFYAVWNTVVRLASFICIGWTVAEIRSLVDQLEHNLDKSLSKIKTLEAFLPICSVCKKIRDHEGSWHQIESYITNHSETKFSHGYCPECLRKVMEDAGLTDKST
jgi:hypothetical protein